MRNLTFALCLASALGTSAHAGDDEIALPAWTMEEVVSGRVADGAEGWIDLCLDGVLAQDPRAKGRTLWKVRPLEPVYEPVFGYRAGASAPVLLERDASVSIPRRTPRSRLAAERVCCRVRHRGGDRAGLLVTGCAALSAEGVVEPVRAGDFLLGVQGAFDARSPAAVADRFTAYMQLLKGRDDGARIRATAVRGDETVEVEWAIAKGEPGYGLTICPVERHALTFLEARSFTAYLPGTEELGSFVAFGYVPSTALRSVENGVGVRAEMSWKVEKGEQPHVDPATNLPRFDFHHDFRVTLRHLGGDPMLLLGLRLRRRTGSGETTGFLALAGRDGFRKELLLERRKKVALDVGRVTLTSVIKSCDVEEVYYASLPERTVSGIRERLPSAKDFDFSVRELRDDSLRIDLVNHGRHPAGITALLRDERSDRRNKHVCIALAPGQKVWNHFKPPFVLAVGDRPVEFQRPEIRALWVPCNPKNLPTTEQVYMGVHRTDGPLVAPRFVWTGL